jgi:hypothetical protein
MSKHWKEKADPAKHLDLMSASGIGGINIDCDANKTDKWVYFVKECSFTFQFVNLEQLDEAIEYFNKKVHQSTREYNNGLEHYWQRWYERLPKGLTGGTKRERILKAWVRARETFRRTSEHLAS